MTTPLCTVGHGAVPIEELLERVCGGSPGDADSVGAHRHAYGLALRPEHVEGERVGELAAELEDVADLDAATDLQPRAADGAGVALAYLRCRHDPRRGEVPAHHDVDRVLAALVGAGDPG